MYASSHGWHCAEFRVRSQEQACGNNQPRLVPGLKSIDYGESINEGRIWRQVKIDMPGAGCQPVQVLTA